MLTYDRTVYEIPSLEIKNLQVIDSKEKHSKKLEKILDEEYHKGETHLNNYIISGTIDDYDAVVVSETRSKRIEELKIDSNIYKFNYYHFDLVNINFTNKRKEIFSSIYPRDLFGQFHNNSKLFEFDFNFYNNNIEIKRKNEFNNIKDIYIKQKQDEYTE